MVRNKYSLIWSIDAVWRLNNIYNWYAEYESVSRAKKVISSIKSAARRIPDNPCTHVQCFEVKHASPSIRKALVARTYWIVFEMEERRIVILDIVHGAMDPEGYKVV
jgi:plasmid stabilization system protein ParE